VTSTIDGIVQARETILRAALDVMRSERRLADEKPSMKTLKTAEDRLSVAAQHLTRLIGDLPAERRPKGWVG
jgi:cell fate (sporulation/competence/biofilm development) regulator YlbF (YheA/YmcA/DUF963 family)